MKQKLKIYPLDAFRLGVSGIREGNALIRETSVIQRCIGHVNITVNMGIWMAPPVYLLSVHYTTLSQLLA